MSNYLVTDSDLTSVANAIRTKGSTSSALEFPNGFVSAIDDITTIEIEPLSVTENGTYTAAAGHAYSPVTVNVSGGTSKLPQVIDGTATSLSVGDLQGATKIKNYGFYRDSTLTSIEIPNTVTEIGNNAFSYATALSQITIPSNVTKIGQYAFQRTAIASITIPSSIATFGEYVFDTCKSLVSATINATNNQIPASCFNNCSALTSISISTNVILIAYNAFAGCTSLPLIDLPSTITSIAMTAFNNCTSLMTIICRATTPPTIQTNTFTNVPATCLIYVPDNSVDTYKGTTNWSARADYIKPLSQYNP